MPASDYLIPISDSDLSSFVFVIRVTKCFSVLSYLPQFRLFRHNFPIASFLLCWTTIELDILDVMEMEHDGQRQQSEDTQAANTGPPEVSSQAGTSSALPSHQERLKQIFDDAIVSKRRAIQEAQSKAQLISRYYEMLTDDNHRASFLSNAIKGQEAVLSSTDVKVKIVNLVQLWNVLVQASEMFENPERAQEESIQICKELEDAGKELEQSCNSFIDFISQPENCPLPADCEDNNISEPLKRTSTTLLKPQPPTKKMRLAPQVSNPRRSDRIAGQAKKRMLEELAVHAESNPAKRSRAGKAKAPATKRASRSYQRKPVQQAATLECQSIEDQHPATPLAPAAAAAVTTEASQLAPAAAPESPSELAPAKATKICPVGPLASSGAPASDDAASGPAEAPPASARAPGSSYNLRPKPRHKPDCECCALLAKSSTTPKPRRKAASRPQKKTADVQKPEKKRPGRPHRQPAAAPAPVDPIAEAQPARGVSLRRLTSKRVAAHVATQLIQHLTKGGYRSDRGTFTVFPGFLPTANQ